MICLRTLVLDLVVAIFNYYYITKSLRCSTTSFVNQLTIVSRESNDILTLELTTIL